MTIALKLPTAWVTSNARGTLTNVQAGGGIVTSPGSGITGAGTVSVDSTVVRTTGAPSIAGEKTSANNVVLGADLITSGNRITMLVAEQ